MSTTRSALTSTESRRPKAYSYLRFSTPDQMDGDSFRRQWDLARSYAERNGLDLDEALKFHDMGVTSFRGANAERGKLSLFRRAVEDGLVAPGSYLLVEDFDRLSRMDPWDALPIFQEIVNRGITLVTLKDQKVWNKEAIRGNALRLIEPLFAMWTSHNESAKKSARLSEVHAAKGKRLLDGVRLDKPYKHGPAWLRWDGTGKQFELIPDRAALVRDVFAKADAGWSIDRIAQSLNKAAVPTWERGRRKAKFWRGARLRKMLVNRAAVGTLVLGKSEHDVETRKRSDKALATIENYFPPLVERELFDSVNARLGTTAPRGRNASRPVSSIVAGLAKCSHCGSSVIRVSKGDYIYLLCSRAHAKAGCKYQAVHYKEVEQALRLNVEVLIDEAPRGSSKENLEDQIANLDTGLSELKDEAKELLRDFRATRSPTMRSALTEAERNIELMENKLTALRDTTSS